MALADDVQILDTSTGGVAGTVRPSRLSGVNLKASDVRYYTTNPQGQIDTLILNDVTGDLWYYGVLDDVRMSPPTTAPFSAPSSLSRVTAPLIPMQSSVR